MSLARLPPIEQDALRLRLEHQADFVTSSLRIERKLVQVFRCACCWGQALSDGALPLFRWEVFCCTAGLCSWIRPRFGTLRLSRAFSSMRSRSFSLLETFDSPMHEEARIEEMKERFQAQQELDTEGRRSSVIPCWSTENCAAEDGVQAAVEPQLRRVSSIGSGIRRRHAHSTHAHHSFTNSLATGFPNPTKRVQRLGLERIRGLFTFIAREEETVNFKGFVMLLILLGEHYLQDKFAEDLHAAIQEFYMDFLLHYVTDNSPTGLKDIRERGPIRRHPGVSEVVDYFELILRRAFVTNSGNSSVMAQRDFIQLAQAAGLGNFPHVCISDIESMWDAATGSTVTANFNQFVEALVLTAFHLYSIDPHRTALPTVASRFFTFVFSLNPWYESQCQRKFHSDIVEPPKDPPQLLAVVPSRVDIKSACTVRLEGKSFPPRGVYVRFGQNVSISSAPSVADGSVEVHVPPVNADSVSVKLIEADDDYVVKVSLQKAVTIAISADGDQFGDDFPEIFVYEDAQREISLRPFDGKLRRVFTTYSTGEAMSRFQWEKFVKDFQLTDASTQEGEDEDDYSFSSHEDEAMPLTANCFDSYSAMSEQPSFADSLMLRRASRRESRIVEFKAPSGALHFNGFLKAIVSTFVKSSVPVAEGLQNMFEGDKWINRGSFPDVAPCHRGEFALKIRRAATAFNVVKVLENAEHPNSPRGGNDPLIEPVKTWHEVDNVSGKWANEAQLDRMLFQFSNDGEENPSLLLEKYEKYAISRKGGHSTPGGMRTLQPPNTPSSRQKTPTGPRVSISFDPSDPKIVVRQQMNQILVNTQRELYSAVARREKDERDRHRRQAKRLTEELQAVKSERDSAVGDLKRLKTHSEAASALSFDSDNTVLQAEKEELQRVFIAELEKRKAKLEAEIAQEEILRDMDRDKAVGDLREQMVNADHMYKRLQDTVRAQAQTIDQQAEVLGVLKGRVNLLRADGSFFRESHDKLVSVVDKAMHRDVLDDIETKRHGHEEQMMKLAEQVAEEMKNEGRRPIRSIKELVTAIQKKQTTTTPQQTALAAVSDQLATTSGFVLPNPPEFNSTYTHIELQAKIEAAVLEKQTEMDKVLKEYEEKAEEIKRGHTAETSRMQERIEELEVYMKELGQLQEQYAALQSEQEELLAQQEEAELRAGDERVAEPLPEEYGEQYDETPRKFETSELASLPVSIPPSPANMTLQLPSPRKGPTPAATPRQASRLGTPRVVYRTQTPRDTATAEIQTETPRVKKAPPAPTAIDEYAKFFGNSVDILTHSIQPGESIETICAIYDVPARDVLRANFLCPPKLNFGDGSFEDEDVSPSELAEADLALAGIPSKLLRIPVPAGMKENYEVLAELRGVVHVDTPNKGTEEAKSNTPEAEEKWSTDNESDEEEMEDLVYDDDVGLHPDKRAATMSPSQTRRTPPSALRNLRSEFAEKQRVMRCQLEEATTKAASVKEELGMLRSLVQGLPGSVIELFAPQLESAIGEFMKTAKTSKPKTIRKVKPKKEPVRTPMESVPVIETTSVPRPSSQPSSRPTSRVGTPRTGTPRAGTPQKSQIGDEDLLAGSAADYQMSLNDGEDSFSGDLDKSQSQAHAETPREASGESPITEEASAADEPIGTVDAFTICKFNANENVYSVDAPPFPSRRIIRRAKRSGFEEGTSEIAHIENKEAAGATPVRVATFALPGNSSDVLVVSPLKMHPSYTSNEKEHHKRIAHAFVANSMTKDFFDREYFGRIIVLNEAEETFRNVIRKHNVVIEKFDQKLAAERLGASIEARRGELLAVNKACRKYRSVTLSKMREKSQKELEAVRHRKEEEDKRRELIRNERVAQIEYRAANAVRLKRMLLEHIRTAKVPVPVSHASKDPSASKQLPLSSIRLEPLLPQFPTTTVTFATSENVLSEVKQGKAFCTPAVTPWTPEPVRNEQLNREKDREAKLPRTKSEVADVQKTPGPRKKGGDSAEKLRFFSSWRNRID